MYNSRISCLKPKQQSQENNWDTRITSLCTISKTSPSNHSDQSNSHADNSFQLPLREHSHNVCRWNKVQDSSGELFDQSLGKSNVLETILT
ncbi:hypothetical protein MUK42_36867 [Musa troglodytarum]|uniref:Uncharacterized protein n=1 Tax=Musa troglodytarum TaxID=320322 RepID=A0A9E7EI87_9LILI|nr:hypothetical protein MUK42_36867 [Musa troglodytarum]